MSYARMSGEYSDLYLISTWYNIDIDDSHCWQCISCKLQTSKTVKVTDDVKSFWIKRAEDKLNYKPPETYTFRPCYNMFNIKAVYRHLRHHIMRGHKVPIQTIQRVVAEYYGVHVSRLQELWPLESWQFPTCEFCSGIKWGEGIEGSLTPYCDGECGLF